MCIYIYVQIYGSIVLTGPVIIRSSGVDVVNRSIINDFVVNGTDAELSLTCTSVYQNEIVEWIRLNNTGIVDQVLSTNPYSSTIMLAHPSEDYYSTFRCKSQNTLLYKDVVITKRKCVHTNKCTFVCIYIMQKHLTFCKTIFKSLLIPLPTYMLISIHQNIGTVKL